jgi:hypothetical protein
MTTKTDITLRWRALYGWVPPSELESFQKKWADFKQLDTACIKSLKLEDDTAITLKDSKWLKTL